MGSHVIGKCFKVLFLSLFAIGLFSSLSFSPTYAQSKPFILPIAAPPGPSTWLLGQPYGNTIGAFLRGAEWYEAGQRLHFGIDLSMPCGTPLVAIGDGEILFVDDLGFGSGPHNLLIRHNDAGVISLYGHLLERPSVTVGQQVSAGEEVALSGDPDITCDSRPHLHLEIRSLNYFTAYNPVDFIEADWHTLSLIGSFRYPNFEQDLDNARQWMSIDDQPPVIFGGRALNAYAAPYPDLRAGTPPTNPPMPRDVEPFASDSAWSTRRLGFDGCCPGAWWHPTQAETLYLIDGAPAQRAGIFEWNTRDGTLVDLIAQAPPLNLSPDGTHQIENVNGQMVIRRLSDNVQWTVDTGGALPALSTDNAQIMWILDEQDSPPNANQPSTQIWVSGANGDNPRMIATENGLSAVWLDEARLLLSRRSGVTTTLGVYDTRDESVLILGAWRWMRSLNVAPGGGRLMFYVVNQEDSAQAGIYTIETLPDSEGLASQAQHLNWFGAWRWRDENSVYYVPFQAEAALTTPNLRQSLHYYDLVTGEDRTLLEANFAIADGDWSVSADGGQVAFLSADDRTIWLAE